MSDIDTLVEMGFARNRAEKALSATKSQGVQLAMDWLFAHADDVDIDEPLQPSVGQTLGQDETSVQDEQQEIATNEVVEEPADKQGPAQVSSLKCEDCGKFLKSEGQVQMHAARTGHQNFAESTEEIKPLTEEEKKNQLEKVQAKKLEKRQEKLETEKQENIAREKMRRKSGKELTDYKQKFEMQEAQKLAEQRRREKIEEKKLRQKLKEQIARDRADRAEKAPQHSPSVKTVSSVAVAPSSTSESPVQPKEYSSCRLQFRLTNGVSITGTFKPTDTLSEVVSYVSEKRTDGSAPFSLSMTFPRKIFTESDMDKTLKDCGLVPSAVLILTKH